MRNGAAVSRPQTRPYMAAGLTSETEPLLLPHPPSGSQASFSARLHERVVAHGSTSSIWTPTSFCILSSSSASSTRSWATSKTTIGERALLPSCPNEQLTSAQ